MRFADHAAKPSYLRLILVNAMNGETAHHYRCDAAADHHAKNEP